MFCENIGVGHTVWLYRGESNRSLLLTTMRIIKQKEEIGGCLDKVLVEGVVANGEGLQGKRVNIFLKGAAVMNKDDLFGNERLEMSDAQRYCERWLKLKQWGFDTVSSMRVVNECYVAMGDMTVDGSAFFGRAKGQMTGWEVSHYVRRKLSPIEEVFLLIDPVVIERQIVAVQEKAWELGVILPTDDPFDLLVSPDGELRLMVVDLSFLCYRRDETRDWLLDERKYLFRMLKYLRQGLLEIGTG